MFTDFDIRFEEVFLNESNFIANASNFSAMVYHNFKDINWVGFYMINGSELILGPFHGKLACVRIQLGHGVCGTAAKLHKAIIVDDVHTFPGHIACDPSSKSELVLPIMYKNVLYGVLDLDSPIHNRFNQADQQMFERYLKYLVDASNMEDLSNYYKIKGSSKNSVFVIPANAGISS